MGHVVHSDVRALEFCGQPRMRVISAIEYQLVAYRLEDIAPNQRMALVRGRVFALIAV